MTAVFTLGFIVAIVGALDTKGAEYAFLKQQIESQGVGTLMIDVGIFGEPPFAPDISAAEVAKAGGADRAALAAANDRGKAVGAMAAGAAIILKRLYDDGRVHGAIAMGGGGGTTLGSIAMQPLPIGAPKLIVSTVASGDTSAYVGVKDIAMMPSIVDVAGVNRLSSKIIANAAGAIAGMVKIEHEESSDAKPMIAATMFGVTTAGVTKAREIIREGWLRSARLPRCRQRRTHDGGTDSRGLRRGRARSDDDRARGRTGGRAGSRAARWRSGF